MTLFKPFTLYQYCCFNGKLLFKANVEHRKLVVNRQLFLLFLLALLFCFLLGLILAASSAANPSLR